MIKSGDNAMLVKRAIRINREIEDLRELLDRAYRDRDKILAEMQAKKLRQAENRKFVVRVVDNFSDKNVVYREETIAGGGMKERSSEIAKLNDDLRRSMPIGKLNVELSEYVLKAGCRSDVLRAVRSFTDFDREIDAEGDHSIGIVVVDNDAFVFRFIYEDKRYDYAREVGKRKLCIMHASEFRSIRFGKRIQSIARRILEQVVG